ncbi:hypothetical protein BDP27DRAFT_761252 [Rhodocollybia butyracea]|uniref:Uncharacterized protein n=1 Tax=Rhodocollybia butyracea TaxID=206335 RepID=A0A9P5PRR5_9AGAR|nr:hypothetical protein BDP27DRAFT_761252 [Rhodocollybia butyracea]
MTSPLSSASAASKMAARRDPDLEPDEQWKENLKAQIQLNLASMVKDAETQYKDNLEKNPADGDRLKMELAAAIDTIKKLATEEFKSQLERERSQRRWATGQELPPELAEDMKKEQQAIWDQIHSGKNSATSPTDDALATSPSDLRNSTSVQSSGHIART